MIIIHGENQLKSRQFLSVKVNEARQQGMAVVRFEGKKILPQELIQGLEGSLFDHQNRLIIIENVFAGPKSSRQTALIQILKKSTQPIIVWEAKKIDGRRLSAISDKSTQLFEYPKILFVFLDSIRPQNQSRTITLFHQTIAHEPIQLVFYLFNRRLRQLILVDSSYGNELKVPSWQKKRLQQQAAQFSLDQLLRLYRNCLRIEISQKTGGAVLDLTGQLDLLMATF